jgi:Cellulase (glycosyl hydrolase family 5)
MLKIANQADRLKIFWPNLVRCGLFFAIIFILPLTSGAHASYARELCGSANGEMTDTTPLTDLCVKRATASAITDQSGNGSGPWTWSCTRGTTTSQCEAYAPTSGGAYEPPGCQPGNHGLVRDRPRIETINGAPVLVADDGCLIVSMDGFANPSGYGPGGVYENPSPYGDVYSSATYGVNLQWMQEVNAVGFNATMWSVGIIDPSQTSVCTQGFPFSMTIDQFVSSAQTMLSYANQTGMYLILEPFICGDWNGANIDLDFENQIWTTLAQDFGQYTNVIFNADGEPTGYANNSCQLEGQLSDQEYLTLRQNGGPDSMFLAFSNFNENYPNTDTDCGTWAQLASFAPDINYSNAAIAWSGIKTYYTSNIGGTIQRAAASGYALWEFEGPESPDDCAFGSDANEQAYMETLMSNNTGWQCDDGWPNNYGPVVPFWPSD